MDSQATNAGNRKTMTNSQVRKTTRTPSRRKKLEGVPLQDYRRKKQAQKVASRQREADRRRKNDLQNESLVDSTTSWQNLQASNDPTPLSSQRAQTVEEELLLAVKKRYFSWVKRRLDGAKVNSTWGVQITRRAKFNSTWCVHTAFRHACEQGDLELVQFLLEAGAKVNPADDVFSPLHCACDKGDLDLVQLLLDAGADPWVDTNWGIMPFHQACKGGYVDIVKYLATLPNEWKTPMSDCSCDYGTPLQMACKDNSPGNLDVVKYLVETHNADVNAQGGVEGCSQPLYTACSEDNLELVQYLAERGANVEYMDPEDGCCPIHAASFNGHLSIVEYLVECQDADFRKQTQGTRSGWTSHGATILHLACIEGTLDLVHYIVLTLGCTEMLVAEDENGMKPLHVACEYGHLDIIRFLGEQYPEAASATAKGRHFYSTGGDLPLHLLCISRSAPALDLMEAVRFLVDLHPEAVRAVTNTGYLPLHCLCHSKSPQLLEVLRFLVERHPASVGATAYGGYLPLHILCHGSTRPYRYSSREYAEGTVFCSATAQAILFLGGKYPAGLEALTKCGKRPLDVLRNSLPRESDVAAGKVYDEAELMLTQGVGAFVLLQQAREFRSTTVTDVDRMRAEMVKKICTIQAETLSMVGGDMTTASCCYEIMRSMPQLFEGLW